MVTEMSTKESPVLTLESNRYGSTIDYRDRTGKPWVCKDELSELFELNGARKIRIFSSSQERSDTYKAVIRSGTHNLLINPLYTLIFKALGAWLEEQITAGRPHIGVRIIK